MTIRECTWCGDSCIKYGQRANAERAFCCRTCYAQWLSADQVWANKQTIVQCGGCGIDISRAPYQLKQRDKQYCTRECYYSNEHGKRVAKELNPNWQADIHIQLPCTTCGTLLNRRTYQQKISKRFFCDKYCRADWMSKNQIGVNHPNWQGGCTNYRGANWCTMRKLARDRDNYTCQHCKITQHDYGKLLDVHHIKPFRDFNFIPYVNDNYIAANDLTNLITLCHACHMTFEATL